MSDKHTSKNTARAGRRGGIGKITGTVGRRIDNPTGPLNLGTGKQINVQPGKK
ncbi:hypothetical protein AB0H36_15870 [Kribbella sp. NPDC050820]|uniref:hypothetical protein n=1 Tax=Kribbella sp. NPDC050820 TaxID=3155408 RepID=UPI0034069CDC